MKDVATIVEELRQQAREHRQEARRCDAAVRALLEPQKAQGRPVKANRDLMEAFRQSGLQYKDLSERLGIGYKYISWVIRGVNNNPKLERRIREVLASCAAENQ